MKSLGVLLVVLAGSLVAGAQAKDIVCEEGQYSTYELIQVFNSSIGSHILDAIKPDFNGTVFIPTEAALNTTLFEIFLTEWNYTGPLPKGLSAGKLLAQFLPDLARYHVLPNVTIEPTKVPGLAKTLEEEGFADLGPYTTLLQNNTIPLSTKMCNISKEADPAIYGKDIFIQILPGADETAPPETTILAQGTNSPVQWSYPTCGGVVHVLDEAALLPCFPNVTKHKPLLTEFMDQIYNWSAAGKNETAAKSGALPAYYTGMLTTVVAGMAVVATLLL